MLFWILYIISEAIIQSKLIKKGWKPDYGQLFVIRGIFSIIHGAYIDVHNNLEYLILLGFQTCSFYIFFDLLLNFLRRKRWDYRGKNSGWLDGIPYPVYYILKITSLLAMIIFYIIGLQCWIF